MKHLMLAFVFSCGISYAADKALSVERWEPNIQKIEQRQKEQPAPKGGIVFAGSSTIVMWDLPKFFPELPVVNCGFGGSLMGDSVYYADRIILPLAPRTIVVYAGDNDIANGLAPQKVADDFKAFVQKIHGPLPETRILYLSIKPSLARWDKWPLAQQANRLIEEFTKTDKRLWFVDMAPVSLGQDGKPRKDFLMDDGLHLNEAGYKAWTEVLAKRLKELDAAK